MASPRRASGVQAFQVGEHLFELSRRPGESCYGGPPAAGKVGDIVVSLASPVQQAPPSGGSLIQPPDRELDVAARGGDEPRSRSASVPGSPGRDSDPSADVITETGRPGSCHAYIEWAS